MDEVFFKSALPAQEGSVLQDSSLALPAEIILRSTDKMNPGERSLRVQQQVQLTLARRARHTMPNGSVHFQIPTTGSTDTRDGPLPNMKVNGLGFSDRSLSSSHMQRPSRRVEVTPTQSPDFPRNRLAHGTLKFGTYTLPGTTQPTRKGTLLDHHLRSESLRRYVFSEVPRDSWLTSTSAHGSYRHKPVRQMSGPQTVFEEAPSHQNGENGSRQIHHQAGAQREKSIVQKQSVYGTLGASQHNEGLAWLTQIRSGGFGRQQSYSPSMGSVEVDFTRTVQTELPIQQTHANNVTALKSENKAPEMTLERAVNMLTQDNEETQISAASFIQNQCLKSTDTKKMVYYLHGIAKLLHLLQNDSEEVQCAAAGALRNVVYQSNENKMEVKENDGLATILRMLKCSRDMETRRELTGLLWNLSSHDLLKERLSREALPILTKSVLVPSSGISEGENPKDELLADSDAFHNATGCLRNLSSSGPDGRKAMRECENLIDSLVYYVRGTIADYKPDDKSVENCVCILHNLSYQIEAELPQKYVKDLRESRLNLAPKPKTVGCFSYRGARITEHLERQCPLLEEKANPRGVEWLWSAITIRMYLSLIARSVRHYTQEAAIGALQNITAGNGTVTEAIAHTIVQRENGLQHLRKMLQEGESDVKKTAVSLIKNLSRYMELQPDIVKQVLPEVVGLLPSDAAATDLPTEMTMSLCHILINLSQNHTQNVKAIVNHGGLPKIINISTKDSGYGPTRASQAASTLLHTMWKHSELHSAYRKCGYRKTDFINAKTTKAVNSG
ncbi:hypothetical protein LDENG_00247220 [Lucifuga dentata]|nr:hypothetical protein LDENG_00247220 [Lucifuga dentata]